MEIERKYLLKEEPEGGLLAYPCLYIEQGYIHRTPVIRIRKIRTGEGEESHVMTVKGSGFTIRQEFELELTKKEYESLYPKVEGGIIQKNRYLVPLEGGLKAEVDVFLNPELQGLRFAEVEFPSEEAMFAFRAPAWFGEDVSFDIAYHNSTLSTRVLGS